MVLRSSYAPFTRGSTQSPLAAESPPRSSELTKNGSSRRAELLAFLAEFAAVLAVYFLPTIISTKRKVPNVGSVVVIDTLLGWTLIGWLLTPAMAARSRA
jgi:hypothetical protein